MLDWTLMKIFKYGAIKNSTMAANQNNISIAIVEEIIHSPNLKIVVQMLE